MPVLHAHPVFDRSKTKLVRRPVLRTAFDTGTGKPADHGILVMVSAGQLPRSSIRELRNRQSAKLSTPHYQGAIEETTLLEVLQETGNWLVGKFACRPEAT